MALKRKPFFSDAQFKRAIVQVMSVFAGYQVQTGLQRDGRTRMVDVPVIFGDYSRTAAYIMGGGGLNVVSTVPCISVDLVNIKRANEYARVPQHSEKIYWTERGGTEDEQDSTAGITMQGERWIPVPYQVEFLVSIWASNNDQAFQLVEQIGTVFNPELDLLLSNSPADWTFLTYIKFEGEFEKTRVAADIGGGTEDKWHVYNARFTTIIQLSPPVKIQEAGVIETIHANMLDLTTSTDFDAMAQIDGFVIRAEDAEDPYLNSSDFSNPDDSGGLAEII